jgi:feruloyl esterase
MERLRVSIMTEKTYYMLAVRSLLLMFALPTAAHAADCGSALRIAIPNARITAARAVPTNDSLRALGRKPYCRVEAIVDEETHIVALLPDDWNGRFMMGGAGGFAGIVENQVASTVHEGYATVGTDAGHTATGVTAEWALRNDRRIADYGHRAVHRSAEVTRALIVAYYGRPPEHSYFIGCSNGGREALMEAQRYPDDYDGIVAGDPANNRIRQTFAFLHSWIATHDKDGKPIIPQAKLALLTRASTEACDAIDGLKDGIIDDPRRCHFDPAKLLCKGADEPGCLTAAQVESAKKTYDGVKNPRTGEQIFTGWPRGSEGFGEAAGQSWRAYIVDPAEPMRVGFFKYWLFHDPNWDYKTIDWEHDLAYAEQKLPYMAAVDKDLGPFKKHGGKLLMYTGWSDPVVPPQDTVAYYEGVAKLMGGIEKTRDFYRFFIAPGMGHCGGGPGPNEFDHLTALEQWVEKGIAPEKMIATHSMAGKVDRTRPLCAYPQVARWKGTGSSDEAANFTCVAPPAVPTVTKATTGTGGQR